MDDRVQSATSTSHFGTASDSGVLGAWKVIECPLAAIVVEPVPRNSASCGEYEPSNSIVTVAVACSAKNLPATRMRESDPRTTSRSACFAAEPFRVKLNSAAVQFTVPPATTNSGGSLSAGPFPPKTPVVSVEPFPTVADTPVPSSVSWSFATENDAPFRRRKTVPAFWKLV